MGLKYLELCNSYMYVYSVPAIFIYMYDYISDISREALRILSPAKVMARNANKYSYFDENSLDVSKIVGIAGGLADLSAECSRT